MVCVSLVDITHLHLHGEVAFFFFFGTLVGKQSQRNYGYANKLKLMHCAENLLSSTTGCEHRNKEPVVYAADGWLTQTNLSHYRRPSSYLV